MNKQEFIDLFNKKDDISAKKVSNLLADYCTSTKNEDSIKCMETMEVLEQVKFFMDSLKDTYNLKEPYTIQSAYDLLRMRIIRNYIDSLKET